MRVEALCISIYRIKIFRIPRVPLRNERIYLIIFINFLHDVSISLTFRMISSNGLILEREIKKIDKKEKKLWTHHNSPITGSSYVSCCWKLTFQPVEQNPNHFYLVAKRCIFNPSYSQVYLFRRKEITIHLKYRK